MRIPRDEMYMEMALLFAKRSTCLRGHVGVVLVRDRRPIGGGYNGAPSGLPHCQEVGCEPVEAKEELVNYTTDQLLELYGCQRSVHAELNAILWAARHGVELKGASMYSTHAPCKTCAQAIAAAKIERFVYLKPYRAERLDILEAAGVKHWRLPDIPVDMRASVI